MKSYSIKRIAGELNIDRAAAKQVRAIVRGEINRHAMLELYPATAAWVRACYNTPRLHEIRMAAINELIGGYGVEGYEHPDSHGCGRYEDYTDYVNMGDTYTATVLHHEGRYWIGCWGDVAERMTA